MKKLQGKNNSEELIKFGDLLDEDYINDEIPIVLARQGERYYELNSYIKENESFEFIRIDNREAMPTYIRTLQFIFIKAVLDIFKDAKVIIEHAIGFGIYGSIIKEKSLIEDDIELIKKRMKEIIKANYRIEKHKISRLEGIEIFKSYGMEDKVRLLEEFKSENISLYKIDDRYDYFYGTMAYSTGILKYFDVAYYNDGFLLLYPNYKAPTKTIDFLPSPKLFNIFKESQNWLNILEVSDVGALNKKILKGEAEDLIRISEALHEKKIAQIADMIDDRKDARVILVAGPSSSGKTTFTKRLAVQLRVNGLMPIMISLDDYFIDRDKTPVGEDGNPDYEALTALDINLFNENIKAILRGEEACIPTYNFKTGTREWTNNNLKLPKNGVVIIEGIHGLNDELTREIEEKSKFKIYISALTQLNLDNHNRILTTDVRKIRRIVRDYLSRGYGCEQTLKMWPSIKRGEKKNIFVFQENADVMFNSNLVYELCVLKNLAIKELEKIEESSDVYHEAKRLKAFLNFFEDIDFSKVPENSILREFIGGSCFYQY
ncbi:nucleoside kinase [Clostridium sp.]|uniref:nucleoside kinase n=1 Tax=Clostridium sp. TaxID=1506 RepID=UPI00399552F1